MTPPLILVPVEPIGQRHTFAFVSREDGCGGFEEIAFNVYPPSPQGEELRRVRVHADPFFSLGDLSRMVGLRAVDVSGLERGSMTLSATDWDRLMKFVAESKRAALGENGGDGR